MLFKWDMEGLSSLEKLKREIPIQVRSVLRQAGNIFVEELSKATSRFRRSKGKWSDGSTKALSTSFRLRSVSNDTLSITSNVPYAWTQEAGDGGKVVAKEKQRMVIPLIGYTAQSIASLRDAKKTFIKKSEGASVIFMRVGRGSRAIGIFKKSVNIPAKHYVGKAEIKATPRIIELFKKSIREMK
jgi:hypothetical protein